MNLDGGFFVMNLIGTQLSTSLSESNWNGFMHISIKGPETFGVSNAEKYFVFVSWFTLAIRAKNVLIIRKLKNVCFSSFLFYWHLPEFISWLNLKNNSRVLQ